MMTHHVDVRRQQKTGSKRSRGGTARSGRKTNAASAKADEAEGVEDDGAVAQLQVPTSLTISATTQ